MRRRAGEFANSELEGFEVASNTCTEMRWVDYDAVETTWILSGAILVNLRNPLFCAVTMILVAMAVTAFSCSFNDPGSLTDKEMYAILQAQAIETAINGYYHKHGKFPTAIEELGPYLTHGDAALIDPWGKRFRMDAAKPGGRLVVWTTNKRGELIQWPRR